MDVKDSSVGDNKQMDVNMEVSNVDVENIEKANKEDNTKKNDDSAIDMSLPSSKNDATDEEQCLSKFSPLHDDSGNSEHFDNGSHLDHASQDNKVKCCEFDQEMHSAIKNAVSEQTFPRCFKAFGREHIAMRKAQWICSPPKNYLRSKHLLKVIPIALLPNLQVLQYLITGRLNTNI